MRKQVRSQSSAGYSLVEMLVVVAMIGIISLVTVPNFISLYRASRMKSSLRNLTTVLRNARMLAVSRQERTKVSYTTSGTHYAVYESKDSGTTWTQVGSDRDLEPRVYFSTTSTFTDQDTDTLPDVIYMPNGTVNPVPDATTSSGNVVIRTDDDIRSNEYTININLNGRLGTTPAKWN